MTKSELVNLILNHPNVVKNKTNIKVTVKAGK